MTTPGLQVDQVAPAFVCVPGVTVEMLAASVTDTRSTNSTSFVGIGVPGIAEPGDMIATFVAPVSGTYKLDVVASLYANPGSNFGYMRLVFDYDTTPIYVGGGNDWKFAHYLNDVRRYSFFDIVNLTAGTHKVKFEWKVGGGTIFADTAIGVQWKVQGTAVTGSGAGGTIITKVTETTAQTISSVYPTWVDITDLTVNVTTSANERVHIHTSVYANPTGTPIDPFLRVLIDGTAVGFYEEGEGANFSVEARIVLWSSPLTAGSHTIKVQGCKYTGHANWVVDVTGYSYLEVAQFRGGLVPIQKDGASVIDTPRALNFIGSGVSVNANTGAADIQLNAALTAPGSAISIINNFASGIKTYNGSTYADIDTTNLKGVAFIIPVAGSYLITLRHSIYSTSTGADGRLKLIFDAGTGSEQNLFDDTLASLFFNAGPTGTARFDHLHTVGPVTLSTGSHTLGLQWKFAGGAGSLQCDTPTAFQVNAQLISGSGAGGTIVTSSELATTYIASISAHPTWTTVPGISVAFTAAQGEQVLINTKIHIDLGGTAISSMAQLVLDGVALPGMFSYNAGWSGNFSFSQMTPALTAGAHTVTLQVSRQTVGTIKVYGGGTTYGIKTRIDVTQFRGGLVPVRKDGASIIDTPAAFDFTGPGCQVANVGGTAKISLIGAEGAIRTVVEKTTSPTNVNASDGWKEIPGLTVSFTTAAKNEVVLVNCIFCLLKNDTGGTPVFGYRLDNGTRVQITIDYVGAFWQTQYPSFSIVVPDPGSHHLDFDGFVDGAGNDFDVYGSTTRTSRVCLTQFRGGYVVPENVPIQTNHSGTTFQFVAAPGRSSALTLLLNDGTRYTATSPISMDISTTGLGGQESSAILPTSVSGVGDSLSTVSAGEQTLTDAAGQFTASMVGKAIRLANVSNQYNIESTDRFTVTTYVSATQIKLGGVGPNATSETSSFNWYVEYDQWYYCYAVPNPSISGTFSVVISDCAPNLGPSNYSIWRYLGAICYANSTTGIRPATQSGAEFTFQKALFSRALGSYKKTFQTVQISTDLSDIIPNTANVCIGKTLLQRDGVPNYALYQTLHVDGTSDIAFEICSAQNVWTAQECLFRISIKNSKIGYRSFQGPGCTANISLQHLYGIGWVDGYLANLPSQLQGTYQPDTTLPQLTWVASSQVTIAAAPGQASAIKLTLQDGTQRSFTGTLTWDPSTGIIDGGLDTGAEASATWYYLYLVPKTGANSLLHVRGSASPPTIGPTGYSSYKYIGAVRNNGSSNIIKFYHTGNLINYAEPVTAELPHVLDGSPVQYDLDDRIPKTAAQAHIQIAIQMASNYGAMSVWVTGSQAGQCFMSVNSWSTGSGSNNEGMLPTPGTTKECYYQKAAGGGIPNNAQFWVLGWLDEYIGGAATGSAVAGANGTLITSATTGGADQVISSVFPTFTDITSATITVTTSAGEIVEAAYGFTANTGAGACTQIIGVYVDGVKIHHEYTNGHVNTTSYNHALTIKTAPLSAGSHTIKIAACKGGAGETNYTVYGPANPSSVPFFFQVTQFRGGLVPVQNNGVEVINTPQAYNFTGSGVQVTNVTGKANIAIAGAEGAKAASAPLTTNPTTISSLTFVDVPGLSVLVTTGINEVVQLNFQGMGYKVSAFNTYIQWVIDGTVLDAPTASISGNATSIDISFSRSHTFTTAGSHTVKIQAKYATATWDLYDGRISVVQFCGGYTFPENIPYLEYNSASQIHLHATPGAISTLRAALNDGKIYTVTAPLTVDLTVSGRGGLDTGTEAVSTWYYVYLVPDGAGTGLSALCSVTAPATGPTGYAIWRYVGAFRNDASGNILKFRQLGNRFLHELSTIVAEAPTTGTSEAAPGTLLPDLVANGHVPVSAGKALVIAWIGQGGSADQWVLQLRDNSTDTVLTCHNQSYSGGANTWAEVPLPVSTKKFYRRIYRAGGSAANADYYAIYCSGYDDEYLAGLQSQLQAKYSPDTKLARLVYNAVGAVDVAAGVGQPSTVLLTLQDGKQRSFSGTLAWAFANGVADLGLDTGAEASSTWYYMYAVPKTGDDNQLSVRASVTPPTTGPTGYTNFKYLGAFRNDGSSNIIKFKQTGKYFSWYYRTQPAASTGWGTTFQTPKIEIAIDDTVPLTAEAVEVFSTLEINHNTSDYVYQEIFIEGESTSQTYCRLNLNRGKMRNYTNLPLIGVASKKIGYRTYDNGSGGTIWLQNFNVNGWWDEYL